MARYTGPKSKIARRFGEAILGPSKALSRKNYAPGMHGKGKRSKVSEYFKILFLTRRSPISLKKISLKYMIAIFKNILM